MTDETQPIGNEYHQVNTNVQAVYQADVINVRNVGGARAQLSGMTYSYRWLPTGSEAVAEFTIDTPHVIRLVRRDRLVKQHVRLEVDGAVVVDRDLSMFAGHVVAEFDLDGVWCEFTGRIVGLAVWHMRVGGHEVFRT